MSSQDRLAQAHQPAEEAMRLHPFYRGKLQVMPKCPVRGFGDFSLWYTPGVAAPCRAIQSDPELVWEHTNRGNTVAVISDGTRVLGLGDIGPQAAIPVMEGKALLFKYLGGVDAVPLCLGTKDPEEFIAAVKLLEPSLGGVNLEDISQPKCFRILDTLRSQMQIPVWHDDQQGSATVALAATLNALKLVGKQLNQVRIAMVGMGAANVATYRLLTSSGVDPAAIVACDSMGALHPGRADIEQAQAVFADKWRICQHSNGDAITGGIEDILRGADLCIAFSSPGPNVIQPEWIKGMAKDAIVFACANPTPEIWPWDAREAGARIVATGRGDFPNQVNNSLGFPAIFRGTLDVRARTVSDEMAIAAARELAAAAEESGISDERIVPRMDEWEVYPRVAAAVAMEAQRQDLARVRKCRETLICEATETIRNARESVHALMDARLIPPAPES